MTPLLGFVPDLPITTPGALVACLNVIPSTTGFESGPSAIDVAGVGTLASTCRGAAIGESTLGVRRLFAGTQTALYSYVAAAWSDVSRAAPYTGGTDQRWSFCQFGDYTIASNLADTMQAASTADFDDIATAPKAKIVVSVANFVLAFNCVDGTYGTRADAWWCSGIFDHTTWAPSISTQANTGRLVAVGGPITAALPFGEQVVCYKTGAMWLGSYVGGSAVWQWQQVQGEVGCVGQEAVCDAQGVHIFCGDDNIWSFDGVRPRPIADGAVRQWWIDNSSPSYRYRTIVTYERRNNRVWIFFPSQGSADGRPDRALVYHMVTGKWGRADREVEAVLTFIQPGVTFDGMGAVASTFDDMPDVSFDSQLWIAGSRSLSVFDAAHQLQTLTGPGLGSSVTLWDIGSDVGSLHLSSAVFVFGVPPQASTCGGSVRQVSGGALRDGSAANLFDGRYNLRQTGRWHSLTFNFEGPVNITGFDYASKPAGSR